MTVTLRQVLAVARAHGLVLCRDRRYYAPHARILRWRAATPGEGVVVVEYWARRVLEDQRWHLSVSSGGLILEVLEGLTLPQAVDALVLAGLLPARMSSSYTAGVKAAAGAIEEHAEAIGWYEGGGVWADAIEQARTVAR